jgi:hypothetical protein
LENQNATWHSGLEVPLIVHDFSRDELMLRAVNMTPRLDSWCCKTRDKKIIPGSFFKFNLK